MAGNVNHISRFEIKYYVPKDRIDALKAFIRPYVELDPHAVNVPDNRYLVRSLYFDTPQLDFYYEKADGLKVRKKLRIRTYNEYQDDSIGFLEIKRRYNNNVVKERSKFKICSLDDIINSPFDFIQKNRVTNGNDISLDRFVFNLVSLNLEPSLLVLYDRDAYMDMYNERVRLTIDYNVRTLYAPRLTDLFTNECLMPVTDNSCILELKFDEFMPKWMRRLVQVIQVRPESISKYSMGIEGHFNNNKGTYRAGIGI